MSFFELSRHDIETVLASEGASQAHAKAVMNHGYRQNSPHPWSGGQLPKRLAHLNQRYPATNLKIASSHQSKYDRSVKFLLTLDDGAQVESVLMPESQRITLCVSSQVGCAQGCSFCHTGRMGLKRHLSCAEIINQIATANQWIKTHPDWLTQSGLPSKQLITNIVYMGMGEPLDNVPAVSKSIKVMTDHFSWSIAARRTTVSTAGHLDGIKNILKQNLGVQIALSVHTPFDGERSRLMPINRHYPIADVLHFLKTHTSVRSGHIMIQYTVIANVNDDSRHAHALVRLLEGIQVKINLIPLNPVGPSTFQEPKFAKLHEFSSILHQAGLRTMIRYSKGQDIAAACGQLVVAS